MSPENPLPSVTRRRALAAMALGLVAPGALAACMKDGAKTAGGAEGAGDSAAAPKVAYEPSGESVDVLPTTRVGADVSNGWFQTISLKNSEGKVVAGTLNRDRTAFTVAEPLGYGA
ncbi:MAG: Ig-like domain-containing protein, partial [Mycobacterium sp.]